MDMDRYIGRMLDDRYEILEVIGKGGMSVVYKARCHRLNRLVAIKILKDENLQDEDFRRRFHAESQAVAMLSHPNIVSVYDVSVGEEADYIVMELIDGITLKEYMQKKGALSWKETLHFASQIAKALAHAHSRGIVHRDIKPHNVMILRNGAVKVADFGIAQIVNQHNTMTKEALGSVHYLSPEQAKGDRVDNRSDIYSLGIVMYEMLTGKTPYEGESPVAVAIQHINGGAIRPSALTPDIPKGLEQIVMRAMAREAGDRYASANDMLQDLDDFRKSPDSEFTGSGTRTRVELHIEQTPTEMVVKQVPKPAEPPKQAQAAKRRRRRPQQTAPSKLSMAAIVICSVVVLMALTVLIFLWLQGDKGNDQFFEVPNLVGSYVDDWEGQTKFEIVEANYKYSDTVPAGQIMDQNPLSVTMQSVGTKIYVTISRGPRGDVYMPNVAGQTETAAKQLLEALDMDLDIPMPIQEYHDTVPAGSVIRTEPGEGTLLEEGQQVILVISVGPEPQQENPNE